MKVVWTRRALARLAGIEDHIAADHPEAAARLVTRLFDRADMLEKHPMLGRQVPELQREDLRQLTERRYRIIYRVRPRKIEILTVFDGHYLRDIEQLRRDLA